MDPLANIKQIEGLLPRILQVDAAWCAHVLDASRKRVKNGKSVDDLLQSVIQRIETSSASYQQRVSDRPAPVYDEALPITAHREEILKALDQHQLIVVAGETGSGKTTQLPKFCLEAGRGTRGLIGCTQPRRIAARAMAERVSEELGSEMGSTVGYQVRFREVMQARSLVKFMTDGILLAEITHDRHLDAYDTLIIDEAHERSLNIDFLLGYIKQLLPSRLDLRVIITSATIDTAKFAAHFNDAPIIEVSGRGYPVEVVYQPFADPEADSVSGPGNRDMYLGIADALKRLNRIDARGDVLVFLSGEREIREAGEFLTRQGLRHTEVLPLYARLSSTEQRRVFHPGPLRRVILSTNVAETSLTVPRIRFVIDTGLARISRYAHRSRIQQLPIEAVSQASANQRMGRCGRLGPGTCIRLYSEEDFSQRPEFTEPEILRTSLATVILRMLSMGLGQVEDFPFIDRPAPRMINDAYHLLFELGAVDGERNITDQGRRLSAWPLDARLARMVLEGETQGCLEDLLVLAAGLSIQDPRERPLDAQALADEAHGRFADKQSDFTALLLLWQHLKDQRKKLSGNQFRKLCSREFLSWQRVLEWFDLVQQLRDQAREEGMHLRGKHGDYDHLHKAVLSGLLSHVGQKHPEHPHYVGARNRQFQIFPGSFLFGRYPKWLMSAEIVETTRTYARVNAEIKPEWLETLAPHLLKHHHRDPYWAERQGRVMALEQVSLFGLVLIEKRRVPFDTVDPAAAREIFLMEGLVHGRLKTRHPFLQHNRELREQLVTLEHKRRKPDVLADDRHIAAIFDSRVPPQVMSAKSLESWLQQEGPGAGQSLMLSSTDLMLEAAGDAPAGLFPDYLEQSGLKFPLTYRFAPGEPDDGISMTVPLELLNRIGNARVQWLVPGLLREKMIELARCLPKPVRRALMPGPQLADSALEALPAYSDQPLFKLLSAHFSKQTGMEISEQMLKDAPIPEHLVLRFVLVDDKGQVLAVSRNLDELQARYGTRAQRQFMDKQGGDWNRDDETEWVFGELPQRIKTANGANAWPGVVDQQDAVGLRLFDSAEDAAYAHLEGVRRLLSLHVQDKLHYLEKNHGVTKKALLVWTGLGSSLQLVKDLVWSSFYAVADKRAARVRDRDAFEKLCSDIRREIGPEHQARARLLSDVLVKLSRLQQAIHAEDIQSRDGVYQDISSQLEDLVYEGFLLDIEASRLAHYSRYLEGALMRLQRLPQDPARDARLMEEVRVFSQRYFDHLESGGEYTEGLDHFRWLIEEFRISLFAQTLGTAEKTSVKRLQDAWRVVTSGG